MNGQPGKLLRFYVNERDEYNGRPLYEALVKRCQELGLAGATVSRGLEGFGESAEFLHAHLMGGDQPIVVTVVERPERASEALPILQSMMNSGVATLADVEVIVVSNGTVSICGNSL
jgi:PII-like signaling protein